MPEDQKPLLVVFVSTKRGVPWGGSEELWHGAAKRLRLQGHAVGVSVYEWPETPRQIRELSELGCEVNFRPLRQNIFGRMLERGFHRANGVGIPAASWMWLKRTMADLAVISQGFPLEGISWMLACRKLGIRYSSVIQAAGEIWWPEDDMVADLREGYAGAAGLYFVSKANHALMELQSGMLFGNASVVSNPWKVDVNGCVEWPVETGMFELACVGRMDPRAKGQDVLLKVLAMDKWRERKLRVNFFGSGPCDGSIKRLAEMLELKNACFHGQVSDVRRIWAENHALILPSRFEGLPLVIVEAMLCGRPVITTDVAGNAEYLRDGITGFVAEAPTPRLLDEALERAWSKRLEWEKMGTMARQDLLAALPADPVGRFAGKLIALAG